MEDKIFARLEKENFNSLFQDFFKSQIKSWEMLKKSYDNLEQTKIRVLHCRGFSVKIQFNPGRITNILTNLHNSNAEKDACFLCMENTPKAQKAINWRDYLILFNPAPIFKYHLTISSMVHRPQRIKDGIGTIFDLSRDLGDHWVLLYNGHRCGASNPHHLHFQAVPKGNLPVEQEITNKKYLKRIASKDNTHLYTSKGLGRTILIIKGRDKKPIKDMFERIFIILREKGPDEDEPMMNMLSFSSDDDLCLAIFPRSKHRPSIFYKKDDPILISPGAFEMAGVIIVARERDFYRVDKNLVEKVYNEVSLNDLSLENIALF